MATIDLVLDAKYEVVLTDPFGQWKYNISSHLGLSYTRVVNEVGTLTITLKDTFPISVLSKHWRIEVWRSIGSGAKYLDTETVWLIVKLTINRDAEGTRTYIVEAVSINAILHSRIVAYNAATAYSVKTDQADDMMKAIVRENMGSSATDTTRIISSTYFSVDADLALGPSFTKSFARRYVDEILKEISDTAYQEDSTKPIYYDVVPYGVAVRFATYLNTRGTDRRQGKQNPVILGPDFGSIGAYTLIFDYSNEFTMAYAGGQGDEDKRAVGTYVDATRAAISPFGRSELWVDSSTNYDTSGLDQEAKAAQRANRGVLSFEGEIINIPSACYGKHWFWGDFVTIQAEGYNLDCRVNGVTVTVDENGKDTVQAHVRADVTI